VEEIDGFKTLIFVHVNSYLLPLFIKKLYFLWHCQTIDNACERKLMRTFFSPFATT